METQMKQWVIGTAIALFGIQLTLLGSIVGVFERITKIETKLEDQVFTTDVYVQMLNRLNTIEHRLTTVQEQQLKYIQEERRRDE